MSDIPDDIRATAAAIAAKANECCYRMDGYEEDIRDQIAEALMAERERCAKIAEDKTGRFWRWGPNFNTRVAQRTCEEIAAAIRSDKAG